VRNKRPRVKTKEEEKAMKVMKVMTRVKSKRRKQREGKTLGGRSQPRAN
jgi:hypothetical protein